MAKNAPQKSPPIPAEPGEKLPKAPRGHIEANASGAQDELMPDLKRLVQLRSDKARLEAEVTAINKELDELNLGLTAKFDQVGIRNMKVADLGTFYRTVRLMPKVESEELLFADLKKRKMAAIIKSTVHYQTLVATINEMREAGEKDLAGVDIFEKQSVAFRRG